MAERTPDPVVLVLGKRAAAVQLVALLAQPRSRRGQGGLRRPELRAEDAPFPPRDEPSHGCTPQVITESARIAVILRMQGINDLAVGPQRTRRPASDESVSC